jgi:acyl-CoA synthetase (AMP-forming)/AMP-acid ligase II/1-acyl-sn-glycerol-3-phosphate acyltransferase/acyl carrier protein
MPFFALITATFFASFGLGYIKFFGLGYITTELYTPADKTWLIQAVGALITVGPALIYFLAGPLAAARHKRWIMATSSLVTALMFIFGFFTTWAGTIWLYIVFTGLIIGFFNSAKMAAVPLEATRSGGTTVYVNGILTIVFLLGMLFGIPCGTKMYEVSPAAGTWLGVIVFMIASISALFCDFPSEKVETFKDSFSGLVKDTLHLSKKYWAYLVAGPLLWGVAGAVSLAITAYAEEMRLGSAVLCSLMSLWAAVGIIIGNGLSNLFTQFRYTAAVFASLSLVFLIAFYPGFIEFLGPGPTVEENFGIYLWAAFAFILLGAAFGVATNLVDADYLEKVGEENKEGPGAAFQSALVAFFNFALNGLVFLAISKQVLDSSSQFSLLAIMAVLATLPLLALLRGAGGMRQALGVIFIILGRFLVALRYRVVVSGLKEVGSKPGLIFLPNHPAEIDPVILSTLLWLRYRIRPLATEKFYYQPGVNFFMRIMQAVPIPDLEAGVSSFKIKRMERTLKSVADDLNRGENFLIYPSGRLMRSGLERMKGSSGLHTILKDCLQPRPVMIRTRGLWGSTSSCALTAGVTPALGPILLKAALTLLKNFLFLTPRREIRVHMEVNPDAFPFQAERHELNHWLENWYNQEGEEELSLVSHSFWREDLPEIQQGAELREVDLSEVPETAMQGVREEFSRMTGKAHDELHPSLSLTDDLGLDSLDQSEILGWLNERFEVEDVEITELLTIGAVMRMAAGGGGHHEGTGVRTPKGWLETGLRPDVVFPESTTLQEAFLLSCERMGTAVALADENSGVLSYKRLKIGALLMAEIIREMPGERIGVMLPATVGAGLISMACLLARKTPVMVNWTLGPRNLKHVEQLTGIEVVLTSLKFLDRAGEIELGDLEHKLVFLEEIRRDKVSLKRKLGAALKALKPARRLVKELGLNQVEQDSAAVILFTSGSETVPKGVPLSHKNIMSNIRSSLGVFPFKSTDAIFGFLPPFHSFGFTVTTMMPILAGLKVAYYPNPNESRKIVSGIEAHGSTIVCGTPSFLSGILKSSEPGQLATLRILVAGAEKAPAELFSRVANLEGDAELIEGYGITECSPILAMNRLGEESVGVGKPPPGVRLLVVDSDSFEPLPIGERGMVLAQGPNIFSGYLGDDAPNPFYEIKGESWYITGDLGILNDAGQLVLAGRLKRFVKIGGEMVSLPAMEDVLTQRWPMSEDGPVVAVEAFEIEGQRPVLCFFSSLDLTLSEANECLTQAGFSNLGRLTQLQKIPSIPVLGTGKTDYRTLKKLLAPSS